MAGGFEKFLKQQTEGPETLEDSELRDYTDETSSGRGRMDLPFLVLVIMILTIGVVMVLSASFARYYYLYDDPTYIFLRQLGFAVSGVCIMWLTSRFRTNTLRRFSLLIFLVSVALLAMVPLIGETRNGAKRWINLGFTSFQPSEIVKLSMILLFANMICTYGRKMSTVKYGVLPFVGVICVVVILLMLEPHISASIIIIAIGGIMMFAGGTKIKWFGIVLALVGVAAVLVMTKFSYASSRITSWLDPESDPKGDGFQILQSLYAVGSGGFLGLGLGQSRQKYLYLPEEHNDYIFAVYCEEMGFVGAILLLTLFSLLILRGFWIALHAKDRYGALIVTGIMSLLAIQVFLNVAVVTNLIPCTGISLPFFSYGGTALWIQLAEMGVVLSVSRDVPLQKEDSGT